MTNEEIIEQLELCIELIKQTGNYWLDERDVPVIEKAIDAIKRQIPKIIVSKDDYEDCPVCGEILRYQSEGYCDTCGQKYVWTEE